MKKTHPIVYVLIMAIAFCGSFWLISPKDSTTKYLPPNGLGDAITLLPSDKKLAAKTIEWMNQRNDQIQTLAFPKIEIRLIHGSKSAKLSGTLVFERKKKFRMIQNSILGKEVDIGSNDQYFWFWSKRMEPPALYYAPHEKMNTTGLRAPFNPEWIMEIMGVKPIELNKSDIVYYKEYWAIIEDRTGTDGRPVTKVTLINRETALAVGHYLFDQTGKILISAEIKDFQKIGSAVIPKNLDIVWFSEGVQVNWKMNSVRHNVLIDDNNWIMPPIRNRINLQDRLIYRAFSPEPNDAFSRSLFAPW